MNPPKVSVIIPVYNTGKYLRDCLDSVVNQTLKDIEILCTDDGSTDGSPAVLREYAARDAASRKDMQEKIPCWLEEFHANGHAPAYYYHLPEYEALLRQISEREKTTG